MGMSAGGGTGAISEINVTPLVDVMLVLLIIFMVAAPMIERERRKQALSENRDRQQRLIELNLPVRDDTDDPTPPDPQDDTARVTLSIAADLSVRLGDASVATCADARDQGPAAWSDCLQVLVDAVERDAAARDVGVVIDAAPGVPFAAVVGSIHWLRRAGVERVGMMPLRASP